jgi:hypothetical protein
VTMGIVTIQRAYAATLDALRALHHDTEPRLLEDLRQALLKQRTAIERHETPDLTVASDVVSRAAAALAGSRPVRVRVSTAVGIAGEAVVNQRLLRRELEEGDAYVQQLFATKRPA